MWYVYFGHRASESNHDEGNKYFAEDASPVSFVEMDAFLHETCEVVLEATRRNQSLSMHIVVTCCDL